MLSVLMPKSATFSALVEMATKWLAMAFASSPNPCSSQSRALFGMGHRLRRGEGCSMTVTKSVRRVEVAGGFDEINPIHIGNKPEDHVALAVVPKRFEGHNRTEV